MLEAVTEFRCERQGAFREVWFTRSSDTVRSVDMVLGAENGYLNLASKPMLVM